MGKTTDRIGWIRLFVVRDLGELDVPQLRKEITGDAMVIMRM
jgi:hypothetical protein